MKTNLSFLFYLFNAHTLMNLQSPAKAQNLPDIIFENTSNNTWIFHAEYANAAFCEYDVCHLVMEPGVKQWVAFSEENGSETIYYDVCNTSGENAITYASGYPECVAYSGAQLNVTASIYNITALGNNWIHSIQVNKVKENQTDSDACLDVYYIQFSLYNSLDILPTQLPTRKPMQLVNQTTITTEQSTNPNKIILPITLFVLAAASLTLLLFKNKWCKNKENTLLGHYVDSTNSNSGVTRNWSNFFLSIMDSGKKEANQITEKRLLEHTLSKT